ncbi:MAG: hybrid sensor histidine kinase/response regulator [Leptolyngbya sp. SIO1D8]|nr:hybrid sensor histidine kinase/response regulator [Leptolyngbya sp. SIO1D8]
MKNKNILIIDDEPESFEVIETLLSIHVDTRSSPEENTVQEPPDYQLYYAANGQEAIASLDTFQPDLILLDVMMPGIDGIEICRQIKAMPKWQAVPIIMVTALNTKLDLAKCLTTGADDFISKPISAVELRARVQSMLRNKQQYDDIQALSNLQKETINILENTLSELQGNLASNLAHELNTPLHGILGTISFLSNHLENLDNSNVREMLDLVGRSAQRLESLTKKFRLYLELEISASQKKPLAEAQTYVSSSTLPVDLKAHAETFERSNDLIFMLEEATISLPKNYLSILLQELVDNALKFSAPETPITLKSQIVGEMLNFSVHDLGRGMTPEQIVSVGPFMQFERNIYEQQGTGMGLKLVKEIVAIAGGQFWINSIYEQETTVNVALPLSKHDQTP